MSSIAGFFSPEFQNETHNIQLERIAEQMQKRLSHRGPDCAYRMKNSLGTLMYNGLFTRADKHDVYPACGRGVLSHLQITCDCSIYNFDQLISHLHSQNISTKDLSHADILLYLYSLYGERFASLLRGGYAMAIVDERNHKLSLFRDPMGIKPLFYHQKSQTFLFASEIKGIFAYPNVEATLDLRGMHQLFSLGPAHVPGASIYKDIHEVQPGTCLIYHQGQCVEKTFWHLSAKRHEESYEDTIDHISALLKESIFRQYHEDSQNCCLLSGGLDSSIVSALVNDCSKDQTLSTYSFDFAESDRYFSSNNFQPSLDKPYVVSMVDFLHSSHSFLECNAASQANLLGQSVLAHDGPCMADISSSLLYFCKKIAPHHKVAFTGECADEVFCGYPWYHNKHLRECNTFPWSVDLMPRRMLLNQSFLDHLSMEDYLHDLYHQICHQISYLPEDSVDNRLHRKQFVLTTQFFMQTLLDRMDRAAAACGMEAVVPFADLDLVEYLYNVPWEMKAKDGDVKHLLKMAAAPHLPTNICQRKKSPYPKNYHPDYERMLCQRMRQIVTSKSQHPILDFIDGKKAVDFCNSPKDYGKPWYGQLMAGPQLIAYYLQIDYWLREYHVNYKW